MEEAVQLLGGRYRLVERLGMGGMSVVWRAYDEVLGRQVAVKVLNPEFAVDDASRERIRTEAQAAARLSHPHITNVYDYGESEGTAYVVMELLTGRTLSERLRMGPLPWRVALRIGAEVTAALAAAHARGLVHRDVKPANVMLTSAGAKVVDFGIAAVAGERAELGPDGTLLGTPAYLAPERLAGGPVLPATDVYAFGLLMYRMLTGVLPWHAETTTQMITANCYAEPDPLPPIDGLPRAIADLCRRCLEKNPDDRPGSRELATVLAGAAGVRVPLGESARLGDEEMTGSVRGAYPAPASRPRGRVRSALAVLRGRPGDGPTEATGLMVSGRAADAAHRTSKRVRLIQAGLAVVGIAALGVLAGTWFGADHGGVTNQAAAADRPNLAGGPNATACQVRYLTMSDAKGTFMVEITVRNSGGQALIGWSLVFVLDGDQRLVQGWSADWTQAGRTVTARSGAAGTQLRAGGSTTIGFTAQYAKANPLPGGFTLNGQECSYSAVGGTGETKSGGPSPGRGNAGGVPGSPTGGGGPGGTPGGFATDGGPGAPPPTDPGVPVPTISPPPSDTGGPTDDPGGGPPEHGPSKKPKPSHKELDLVVVPEAYQVEVLPLR